MLFLKLIKGFSFQILALLCVAIFIAGCDKGEAPVTPHKLSELKVGYIPIADAAQLYVAKDMDLFRKHGIEVKPIAFAGGAKIIQALSAGELDVGFTGTVPLIQANSRGLQIRAITGGSIQSEKNPYQAIAVSAKSEIVTPQQLIGATIGVNVFKSIDHAFALAWLEKHDVEGRLVKFVEIPFPQMEAALSSKQIQAASMIEPYLTLAKSRRDVRILGYHIVDVKPNFEMTTYAVTLDKLNLNRKEFKAFQAAVNEATDLINNGNVNLVKVISENVNLDENTVSQMAIPNFGNKPTVANLKFVSDMMMKLGFIETAPNVEELILTLD